MVFLASGRDHSTLRLVRSIQNLQSQSGLESGNIHLPVGMRRMRIFGDFYPGMRNGWPPRVDEILYHHHTTTTTTW